MKQNKLIIPLIIVTLILVCANKSNGQKINFEKKFNAIIDSMLKFDPAIKKYNISLEDKQAFKKSIDFGFQLARPDANPCLGYITDNDHEKTLDEAVSYILSFQKPYYDPNIKGGWTEIPIAYLRNNFTEIVPAPTTSDIHEHCGLMTYFCYDTAANEYYLSYTSLNNVNDRADAFPIQSGSEFYRSSCSDQFQVHVSDKKTLKDILQSTNPPLGYEDCPVDPPISITDYLEVNKAANLFLIHILGASLSHWGVLENPVGLFHNNQIVRLINQSPDLKGIRIYWSYEDTQDNNYIKIVAFAIKSDGTNYTVPVSGQKLIILERSWPPD